LISQIAPAGLSQPFGSPPCVGGEEYICTPFSERLEPPHAAQETVVDTEERADKLLTWSEFIDLYHELQ
jgi:hypothetical protein